MNILGGIGGLLVLVGWIWAIVNGFQKSGALWGVVNIIPFQPLIGIISAAMSKISWTPVLLMIIGAVLSAVGSAISF
ncbi:MAG: hypothetical protein OEM82_12850 [Acidobacteriota bacterium]|nr:hypothetical protein [Acidobacteriota bacterium]MDH3529279.1 hypothetical protein [Acidobacteriota bacterium]